MPRGATRAGLAIMIGLALSCGSIASAGHAFGATASVQPPSIDALVSLLRQVRNAYEQPGIHIEPAAKKLGSAPRAFAFVRDDTAYLRYAGRIQSAVGTLRTRTGNPVDRVALLGAL